jgi:exopolyphosphatase/guanosine-5'-triphosphate,3'-diphosphate pyrophosphatase
LLRSTKRAAAIDIGTNTVLLLVAERAANGTLHAVAERATITRLGEGVDRSRRLSSEGVARTRDCLSDYARVVREMSAERVSVVGTSAMRDANGGEELREIVRSLFGVDARVLSGEDEASLTFRGAIGGLSIPSDQDVAVFDIGGGSTEVVMGRAGHGGPHIAFGKSYDMGSVRLTERYIAHDPPSIDERDTVTRVAESAFAGVPGPRESSAPIGVAGTMTTLASVSLGLAAYDARRVHGLELTLMELRRIVTRLATIDLDARKNIAGMEPKRADVIVAGGLIAIALLDHWGASSVRVSDRGVRWGLAEELLPWAAPPSGRRS